MGVENVIRKNNTLFGVLVIQTKYEIMGVMGDELIGLTRPQCLDCKQWEIISFV